MHNKRCSIPLAVVICFLLGKVSATGYEQPFCADLKPQNSLDINQIMGMWYGVEIIPHLREEDGVIIYDSCPVIHLSETTYEMSTDATVRPGEYAFEWSQSRSSYGTHDYRDREYRHLRLYWDEHGNNIEYSLKFNNTRRGFWVSSGPQSGAAGAIIHRQYNQFAGTVQVLKAVGDHLVLTFCQRLPESQLFTVILSREPQQLTRQMIHSIHSLIDRKDLSTSAVRKVCRSGAIVTEVSFGAIVIFVCIQIMTYF